MADGTVAQTTPYTWNASSWSGDIILNSNAEFTTGGTGGAAGNDLYSVILHEAGHSLGFTTESDDPNSVMYGSYVKRTGLGAVDIAAIQSMYGGARTDVAGVTATTAVKLDPLKPAFVRGEITKAGEVDTCTFLVPAKASTGESGDSEDTTGLIVTLRTAGVSLFQGKVTVYDEKGKLVATVTATDPVTGQLNINILKPKTGTTDTIKVQGATPDAFGVGDYFVAAQAVGTKPAAPPVAPAPAPSATVTGNSSLASPAELAANSTAADGRVTDG